MQATTTPPPAPRVERTPREDQPLFDSVYQLLRTHLPTGRYSKPVAKRLALLVSGLVAGDTAGLGAIERTVSGLAVTSAKPESIARRLRRILDDARLDPTYVLPDLLVTLLPMLLSDVQALLPAVLRDHVLLIADRAFGVSRMLDLLGSLSWHWLLHVQGHTRVLLRDGIVRTVRSLAPLPGSAWLGRFDPQHSQHALPPDATNDPVDVFKAAGWRASQVVAVWAPGADEPWLLVTSLAPTPERLREYAERWGIERLFLSWKSHGWDLEACGVHDPVRLGRLVSGIVLATHWRLAAGVLAATHQLADLRTRAQRRRARSHVVRQLPLPLDAALQPHQGNSRPYAAKQSLFTRGTTICRTTPGRFQTPPVLWAFPDWHAPIWSRQAQQVYDGLIP